MEIFKMAGRNADSRLTDIMIEEEVPEYTVSKIYLISHQVDAAVLQEFIPGKPGCSATGTGFK